MGSISEYGISVKFDRLYDRYSPKVYGFIRQYSESKEEADEYLINVFCNIYSNIHDVDINDERTIQRIVISTCKPLLILKDYTTKRIEVAHE